MLIQAFEWDEYNAEHVATHGVTPDEVEEALLGRRYTFRTWTGRYVALGRSQAGRHLFIVFEYLGGGVARPFSARDMNPKDRRLYRLKI